MRNLLLLPGRFAPRFPLSAAEADSDQATVAGEIIVTARVDNRVAVGKSDARLIETPQLVSVVDRSVIEAINTKTISESLGYTPGLVTQSASFARTADNVYLRGFPVNTADGSILLDGLKPQAWPIGAGRRHQCRQQASVVYRVRRGQGTVRQLRPQGTCG